MAPELIIGRGATSSRTRAETSASECRPRVAARHPGGSPHALKDRKQPRAIHAWECCFDVEAASKSGWRQPACS
eukprot:1772779-Pyramimonas_sp.AAC.1